MSEYSEKFRSDFKQITGWDWDEHPDSRFKEMALHLWQAGQQSGPVNN